MMKTSTLAFLGTMLAAGLTAPVAMAATEIGVAAAVKTNAESVIGGQTAPLLTGDTIEVGVYELTFHVADYFRRAGVVLTAPPFLGDVVVRIGVADAHGHYHVPLLVSPYGYSTYRGT